MVNIQKLINQKKYIYLPLLILSAILIVFISIDRRRTDRAQVLGSTAEMENVQLTISPSLDFSRFSPYTMTATNVPANPLNVSLNLSVDLGDSNTCWDFNTIGECASQSLQFNMTYNSETQSYTKPVYIDYIYPEIFFAPSEITWNNAPNNTPVRRNEYQIFHFINMFATVSNMNLWVEFNTAPLSVSNSSDLQVYIVEKGHNSSYFNSDWRIASGTELIGSVSRNTSVSHTHTANSSHHVIRLGTDLNGHVGNKALDVSGDFWIVLYSNSPNTSRGWNLRYQPSNLCDNNGTWYKGDISGWTTTLQAGCPDAHIRISRNSAEYMDSVVASVSATYEDGTYTSPLSTFNFVDLPNLAPNPTSFVSPIAGSKYSGNLNIAWNPATDPNIGDTLDYTIYLTKTGQSPVTIALNTTNTSLTLNTTTYLDGEYILSGKVCDNLDLCTTTDFSMEGPFYIDNIITPETLSSIAISSNNSNPIYAKVGDIVTLNLTSSGVISQPNVSIYSSGEPVTNSISVTNTEANTWQASYIVSENDSSGSITFEISSSNLDKIYYQTTNQSSVTVDVNIPNQPLSSINSGTYVGTQNIILTSSPDAYIKYLFDVESLSCNSGHLYESALTVVDDTTLKAIACDSAGNMSNISSYTYVIKRTLDSISVSSSNSNDSYAKVGDTISISMNASSTLTQPVVNIYSGGVIVTDLISITNTTANTWIASFTVADSDTNGVITFEITSSNLNSTYSSTTDDSSVVIDTQAPSTPFASKISGTYIGSQSISLNSSSYSYI